MSLQCTALADQPGKALRSAIARHYADLHFGLTEPRPFRRDSIVLAIASSQTTTERKTIHSSDHRLAEIFN